jgi:hypothetical protein
LLSETLQRSLNGSDATGSKILYFNERKKRRKGARTNTQTVVGTEGARKWCEVVQGVGTDGGTNEEGAEM